MGLVAWHIVCIMDRVSRDLLMEGGTAWKQRDIQRNTGLAWMAQERAQTARSIGRDAKRVQKTDRVIRWNEREDGLPTWAIVFLGIAIAAALLGFAGIAGTAAWIAQVLFSVFILLFLVFLIVGYRPPPV